MIFWGDLSANQYKYGYSIKDAFSHLKQCRNQLFRIKTQLKVVIYYWDPSNYQVSLAGWEKIFIAKVFDLDDQIFIVHIAFLASSNIYLFHKAKIAFLITDEVSIIVLVKYVDFVNIFSLTLVIELPEHTGINNHSINVVKGQQLP